MGVLHKMIVYMGHTSWKYVMLKMGIHPFYLKWFLLLREFKFEVYDNEGTGVGKSPF